MEANNHQHSVNNNCEMHMQLDAFFSNYYHIHINDKKLETFNIEYLTVQIQANLYDTRITHSYEYFEWMNFSLHLHHYDMDNTGNDVINIFI